MKKLFVVSNDRDRTISRQRFFIFNLAIMLFISLGFVGWLAYLSPFQINSPQITECSAPDASEVVAAAPSPTVELLFARHRIQSGDRLDESMFEVRSVPEGLLPAGAYHAAERTRLDGKYAAALIPTHSFITDDFTVDNRNGTPFEIPSGFRAVSMSIDSQSGVEGFARPGTRVDVLWTYRDQTGADKVLTIVQLAKVLSVSGLTEVDGAAPLSNTKASTATLLVPSREAKLLQLAQSMGRITLSLAGDSEEINSHEAEATDLITVADLLKTGTVEPEKPSRPASTGTCLVHKDKGQPSKTFVLNSEGWKSESVPENDKYISGQTPASIDTKENEIDPLYIRAHF